MRFKYKAKDRKGKIASGRVEAVGAQGAAKLLRDRGLVVIKITPERDSPFSLLAGFFKRVTLADVSIFTRQFSTMITAGLPIIESLSIIRFQAKTGFKPVITQMLSDIEGGSSLAGALGKHPAVFSGVYVALIRAGEEGGVLDKVLSRLADNLETQRDFRSKVKGALIYPAIILIGMAIVGTLMMIFVIPRLAGLYTEFGAELPLPTRVLIGISGFLISSWWLVIGIVPFLVWGLVRLTKTQTGRQKIDRWRLKAPVFGPLEKKIILAEFTRTLGLLVGAGVPILEALRIVSDVVGNTLVRAAVERVEGRIEKGFSVAYALSQEPEIFPPMLFQMLAVGEETGALDETLLRVAGVFEQESEYAVRGLSTAMEPLIMIVLGVGVAFLVISIIMPIYNLTSQF